MRRRSGRLLNENVARAADGRRGRNHGRRDARDLDGHGHVESAAGIEEGGRTGLTALVVAALFLASLAIVPLAAAIPLYASHIALVVVAVLMLGNVADVDWNDPTHAVPAGVTIIAMPLTLSIAYGIAAGIIAYPVMKLAAGERREVSVGQWLLALAFVGYFALRTSGALTAI